MVLSPSTFGIPRLLPRREHIAPPSEEMPCAGSVRWSHSLMCIFPKSLHHEQGDSL